MSSRYFYQNLKIYTDNHLQGIKLIVQLAKNVLIEIVPWVCLCGGYGFFISWLDYWELVTSIFDTQVNTNAIVNFNLGISIILILRTHIIAHYRFWQGIKLWKRIVNVVQNLVSEILLYIEEQDTQDLKEKKAAMRLVAAFAVAIKLHLQKEPANFELESLVLPPQY